MFITRGTAIVAALGLLAGAIGLAAAQQPNNTQRPNARNQTNQNQNNTPAQTPSRTPRTPRPSGTTPATPAQPGTPGTGATLATPATPGNGQTDTALTFVRASAAVNAAVQSSDGQQIGTIADLLLTTPMGIGTTAGGTTTETGAATGAGLTSRTQIFALINVDAAASTGRVAVIPWDLLRYENGVFILGFDVARLSDVPSVMLDDPRLLQSQQWLGQVNDFFADDLRQIQRARPDLDNPTPGTTTPRRPNTPATPGAGTNPRTPRTGTNTPDSGDIIGRDRALQPPATPAPRTSSGTTPNP